VPAHKNKDLHGSVPDSSRTALLVIDVINDFQFPGGEKLLKRCLAPARRIAALKERLGAKGIPVIYANDNYGKWKSDFNRLVEHSSEEERPGSRIANLLLPTREDYFVLKPKHSAFFSTSLETLLQYLGTKQLILTGFTTNQCILFTANDAYIRDFDLWVPRDCTAAMNDKDHKYALYHLEKTLGADTRPSTKRKAP
jgi:nicotinamidase-related amidase